MCYFCTFISSNKVFLSFFFSFQLSFSNPFTCSLLSNIFTCHIFIILQCEFYKEELFQLSRTHNIHYSQSIVWAVVMNNQNMWKIIKIEKSNKYRWGRTNHSLNITRIILFLISYEMKITKHLSICFILNTNVRS